MATAKQIINWIIYIVPHLDSELKINGDVQAILNYLPASFIAFIRCRPIGQICTLGAS